MRRVVHSLLAEQDLVDLWRHVAPHNVTAANELLRLIDKTCSVLAEHPHIGRDRGNILEGMLSFPVGNHLIFYRVSGKGIEVVRVLHGARDVPSVFRDEH